MELCAYQLPVLPAGSSNPQSEVTAIYYPGGGISAQEVFATVDASVPCTIGWEFADPADPTSIEFCTETCAMIQADPAARIEIYFGCYSNA